MYRRITERDLEAVCKRINEVTGNPAETYKKEGEKYIAQLGNYHLSYAYGGVSLHRMDKEGGGVSDVFGCGHTTKRDLYNRMQAYISGYCDGETA